MCHVRGKGSLVLRSVEALVLVAASRESTATRRSRGSFTLHDERASARKIYPDPNRARGHAGSNDNITIRKCVTTRKGVQPNYHIDYDTTPRLHPRRKTVRALYRIPRSTTEYTRGQAVTIRKDVTTSNIGQPNNLPEPPIPATRRRPAPREPPRKHATRCPTKSPTTRPREAASTAGSKGIHHQRQRGLLSHMGLLSHRLRPDRADRPHRPRPRGEGSGESLARP